MEDHAVHGIDAQTLLGGLLLDQFESFQHTPCLFEIVAGFQCHPPGVQIAFPRFTCDDALRMAAHLPDLGCAGRGVGAGTGVGAATATAVGAGRGVGAAAGTVHPL